MKVLTLSKLEKAIQRLKSKPKDYTYSEAKQLLGQLGFSEYNKGKTSGSRVKFLRPTDNSIILLHKPHPGDIMSPSSTRDLHDTLKNKGDI